MFKVANRNGSVFGNEPYICEFVCDTTSDVPTLPTSISEGTGGKTKYDNQLCSSGSIATVIDNGSDPKKYILDNQNTWRPYSVSEGSSISITVDSSLSDVSKNPVENKVVTAAINNKADISHTHSANEVGADPMGSAESALASSKEYTDSEIAGLINGAPTTMDTLKEIADAMAENQTVVEALDAAIGTKADKTDIPTKVSELENDSGYLTEHQDLSSYALKSLYGDTAINLGRLAGSAVGSYSTAEGYQTTASGNYSHAEGHKTTASYYYSHAEGDNAKATSDASHAEGYYTTSSGSYSHAEGANTTSSGSYSHAEGDKTTASGTASHAEGSNINVFGDALSDRTITISDGVEFTISGPTSYGTNSHAEGTQSFAYGCSSHAEGYQTTASGGSSHAEGDKTTASDTASHAEGYKTTASDWCCHAEGTSTKASASNAHAEGDNTTASNYASHACGHYNAAMTTGGAGNNAIGTAFVIGNGTGSTALSNAFSVQYTGIVKARSTITASTTADYAEFFEWLDENPDEEDRVGYFVTLDGDKIRIATNEDDYILGVVSGEPFVLGNGDCDTWNGMFLRDEFRRTIYEPAPKMVEILDSDGNPTGEFEEVEGEFEGTRPKLNPEYDHTQPYISRFDRKEWAPVGMLGVLAVRHDGTAQVNGYVTVNVDGIATACYKNSENSYRVIKANSDTVVEIIFR